MRTVIRGRGYVFQGVWLGSDPAAFNEIEILSEDVSIVERQSAFTRYITRHGREVIMFDPRTCVDAPVVAVIDATPATPLLSSGGTGVNLKSQKALPSPKKKGK